MVGQVAVIATSSGLQVYATSSGRLLFTIPNPGWWKLATDGSYIATGTASALTVWSPAGQVELTRGGDYHKAVAFAAPAQIQMSNGPSGANVIETVSVPSGAFSVSPAFQGGFSGWFQDGESFFTTLQPAVWIYSKAGILRSVMSLPSLANLGGAGNWLWSYTEYPDYALRIYSIGSANPVATYSVGFDPTVVNGGTFIGVLGNTYPTQSTNFSKLFVVDLTGAAPSETVYDLSLTSLAGISSKNWVGGGEYGSVLDGSNLPASPRYFGYGAVLGMAGNSNQVVLSTSIGKTLLFDTQGPNKVAEFDIPAGTLSMSSDGTLLAAAVNGLSVYSLPSGTLLSNFPHSNDVLFTFSLSGSGTALGQTTGVYSNENWSYQRQVTGISGSPLIWSDTGFNTPLLLSPDGTTIGADTSPITFFNASSTTLLVKNGSVVSAVNGYGEGWIDNSRILVALYGYGYHATEPSFIGSQIDSASGETLLTIPAYPLPAITSPQFTNANSVYDPDRNTLYSLDDGTVLWQGDSIPYASRNTFTGTLAGPYIAYFIRHQVFIATY